MTDDTLLDRFGVDCVHEKVHPSVSQCVTFHNGVASYPNCPGRILPPGTEAAVLAVLDTYKRGMEGSECVWSPSSCASQGEEPCWHCEAFAALAALPERTDP